ncbi:AAA family ATPase [Paenibacillus sp. NPDC056579]|uniref:AAA family ATPase n=1 Tax=Paenibacillus sp. NPDC056579 TaxID=3345871 RepID=UPI0036BBCBE9
MKLAGLDVSGFKLYGQKQSFTFGMVNEIMGDRGKGKTTLCEAIIWCLKGCDMKGNSRGILKHLKNESTKEMTVVTRWHFPSPDGGIAHHELSRMSKGRSMRLLLDGEQADQAAFDSLFGPTDVFLSVFLPGYFGGLAAAKAREVLLALLPAVDVHAVFDSLSGDTSAAAI